MYMKTSEYYESEFYGYKVIGEYCIHRYKDYEYDGLFNIDDDPNYEDTIGVIYKFNINNPVGMINKRISTGEIIVRKFC